MCCSGLFDGEFILVVDDNAGAAEALAIYLSYEGVEARAAMTGPIASSNAMRASLP